MRLVLTTAPQIQTIFFARWSFPLHGFQTDHIISPCLVTFSIHRRYTSWGQRFSLICTVIRFSLILFLSTKTGMEYGKAVGYYFRDCWILHWLTMSVMAASVAVGRWTSNKDSRQDVCRSTDWVKCLSMRQKMIFRSRIIVFDKKVKYPGELTQQDLENIFFQWNTGNWNLRIRKQEPKFPHKQ